MSEDFNPVSNLFESEFVGEDLPRPYRGMTTIEAGRFLRKEFPEVRDWMCWLPGQDMCAPWMQLIPAGRKSKGRAGEWVWSVVESAYPVTWYWSGEREEKDADRNWTGVIRVRKKDTQVEFLLFSYLAASGTVGDAYFASTKDWNAVGEFSEAVRRHYGDKDSSRIRINVVNGPDICLDPNDSEDMIVDPELRQDIENQVVSFFRNRGEFARYGIKPKRGMLFCGPPGNGKTLMIRHLIRMAWKEFKPNVVSLRSSRRIDEHMFHYAFTVAREQKGGILVLEDMDSLTQESGLTRAAILEQLDGLECNDGVIVLASTNNPQDIDPALVNRPSRFDRVWHFELPSLELRIAYLKNRFRDLDVYALEEIAERTEKWSFAYLGELYVTSVFITIQKGRCGITPETLNEAYDLLAKQFKAGSINHRSEETSNLGFRAA